MESRDINLTNKLNEISATGRLGIIDSPIGDEGLSKIADYFVAHPEHMDQLSFFMLHDCCISHHGISHLAMLLRMMPKLQEIYLGSNDVSHEAANWLAKGIRNKPLLRSLGLRNCSIDAFSANELMLAARTLPLLIELDLSNNPSLSGERIDYITTILSTNSALQALNLSECDIGNEGAIAIGHALETNVVLRTLDIPGNEIEDTWAFSLAQSIRMNTTLNNLHVQDNEIQARGAGALIEAFSNRAGTGHLTFAENLIGSTVDGDGWKPIASAISGNLGVWKLDLSYNEISKEDAAMMSEALKGPGCGIRVLEMWDYDLKLPGINGFIESLCYSESGECNSSLLRLEIMYDEDDETVPPEGRRKIESFCRRNLVNTLFSFLTSGSPSLPLSFLPLLSQEPATRYVFTGLIFKLLRNCTDLRDKIRKRSKKSNIKKRKVPGS